MRKPTTVTTRTITSDSGVEVEGRRPARSRRRASRSRASGRRRRRGGGEVRNCAPTAKATSIGRAATDADADGRDGRARQSRRPSARTRKPARGSAGISHEQFEHVTLASCSAASTSSVLKLVVATGAPGPARPRPRRRPWSG